MAGESEHESRLMSEIYGNLKLDKNGSAVVHCALAKPDDISMERWKAIINRLLDGTVTVSNHLNAPEADRLVLRILLMPGEAEPDFDAEKITRADLMKEAEIAPAGRAHENKISY